MIHVDEKNNIDCNGYNNIYDNDTYHINNNNDEDDDNLSIPSILTTPNGEDDNLITSSDNNTNNNPRNHNYHIHNSIINQYNDNHININNNGDNNKDTNNGPIIKKNDSITLLAQISNTFAIQNEYIAPSLQSPLQPLPPSSLSSITVPINSQLNSGKLENNLAIKVKSIKDELNNNNDNNIDKNNDCVENDNLDNKNDHNDDSDDNTNDNNYNSNYARTAVATKVRHTMRSLSDIRAICICDALLIPMTTCKAGKLMNMFEFECDNCQKFLQRSSSTFLFHCPNDSCNEHPHGYDLCVNCAMKTGTIKKERKCNLLSANNCYNNNQHVRSMDNNNTDEKSHIHNQLCGDVSITSIMDFDNNNDMNRYMKDGNTKVGIDKSDSNSNYRTNVNEANMANGQVDNDNHNNNDNDKQNTQGYYKIQQ